MGHDEHFLSRISRLDREHAELALGLYHDSQLVRTLLNHLDVPDGVERVALSLDDRREGPFILVQRTGAFVTCLGRGMKISSDMPVVPRHRIDHVSEKISALRDLLAEVKSGGFTRSRKLVRRVQDVGDGVTREQFEDLARWTPVLGQQFLRGAAECVHASEVAWQKIRRIRNLSATRHEDLLRSYWRAVWGIAHFGMLLGAEGKDVLAGIFDRMDRDDGGVRRTFLFPESLVRTMLAPFAMRGAWIAGRFPKLLRGALKTCYRDARNETRILSGALGLVAIAHRHTQYRTEVDKVLAGGFELHPGLVPEYRDFLEGVGQFVAEHFRATRDAQEASRALGLSQARTLLAELVDSPETEAWVAGIPDDVATAFMWTMPIGLFDADAAGLQVVLEGLPGLARADARDFYVPASHAELLDRGGWRVEDSALLVGPRLSIEGRGPGPARAGPKVGRNTPCPCGSGKKYKRCCGR